MKEEVIQMVDDDEIENVGIMSGFMDELEELISEIDAEDLENSKGGDEADTAKLMGRTPDSPEILMNNLRGDMRSVDARREELADLVGMREAEETPEMNCCVAPCVTPARPTGRCSSRTSTATTSSRCTRAISA